MQNLLIGLVGFVVLIAAMMLVSRRFYSVILNLDRRIIYAIVAILVLYPLIKPLALPMVPTPETRGIFDALDALPEGSPVLIGADFDPASKAELQPMLDVALAHCFERNLKPTILTLWEAGPRLVQGSVEKLAGRYNKVSGVDYVWLGYRPGTSAVILGTVSGMTTTYGADFYNKPTGSMPYFANVKKLSDYKYLLDIAAGATVEAWVIYGAENANVPMGASCTAVSVAQYYTLLQAGQITGLAGGMKGSAEYEKLVNDKYGSPDAASAENLLGDATKGMDAQSMVHIFIVLSIIFANIAYFYSRRKPLAAAGRAA
ncbi:MAG: hypothetical protein M3R04_04335 [bacterium]|nr:hypothetical protein [bacterium]